MNAARALQLELRWHRDELLGMLIISGIALILALLGSGLLTGFAPLWAALALARYGRQDTPQSAQVRAGLNISRADALRARLRLVGIEGSFLIGVSTAGVVIGMVHGFDGSAVSLPDASDPVSLVLSVVLTAVIWCCSVTLTMLAVGRECLTRRPGGGMYVFSILSFIGSSFLVWFGTFAVLVPARIGGAWLDLPEDLRPPLEFGIATVVALAAFLVLLAHLRRRSRVWIAALDQGAS